jgi:hypothetical protein
MLIHPYKNCASKASSPTNSFNMGQEGLKDSVLKVSREQPYRASDPEQRMLYSGIINP